MEGIIKRQNEFPIRELWLVDIEDGREKWRSLLASPDGCWKNGLDIPVYETLDRTEALLGADFVCFQFRAGCLEARISDERISLKYDMIGQETNGLGGFANACRTIPIALAIAKEMEQLCRMPGC